MVCLCVHTDELVTLCRSPQVLARRGLQLDSVGGSAGTEKDDHVDSGPSSSHSHHSHPGSYYSSSSATSGSSGASGGGTSGGSAPHGSKSAFLLRCCKTEKNLHDQVGSEDDHTILHEILSSHQQGLSNAAKTAPARAPLAQLAQPTRGRGVLGVRTRAMLGSQPSTASKLVSKFNVGSRAFEGEMSPVLGGPYHSISAPPSVYAQAHLHQLRCNSAMSVLTDCEAAASPTAPRSRANCAPAVRSESGAESVSSESGMLSNSFASASLANRADTVFTSLAAVTPLRTPARAGKTLPGLFPALEGLPTSTLRSLGVSGYDSPSGKTGEVPLFPMDSLSSQRCGSAQSYASSNSSASSATSVRRNYFSALEEHMASEHHADPMAVDIVAPVVHASSQPFGSASLGGSGFHTHSAFQPVRRVSISEGSPTATVRRSLSDHSDPSHGAHAHTQLRAPSQLLERVTAQRTDSTDRESVELDDQELASYMDPLLYYSPIKAHLHVDSHSHPQHGIAAAHRATTEEAAAMMWHTWETGTSADMHSAQQEPSLQAQAPSTPVHMPFSPVGCAGTSLQCAYELLAGGRATPTSVAAALGMGAAVGIVSGPLE